MADTPKYNEQARELFNQGNLQAWPYGPVDPGVYQDYKNLKIDRLNLNVTLVLSHRLMRH